MQLVIVFYKGFDGGALCVKNTGSNNNYCIM